MIHLRQVWLGGAIAAAACLSALAAVKPAQNYGKLPLTFEVNAGQTDGRVKYLSRGAGYTLFLTADNQAVVSLARTASNGERQTAAIRMSLPGSRRASSIRALEPRSTVSNYIHGNDPKHWLTGVRHYGRVSFENVYRGINVVYYGNQRQLEYDFVVAPGTDPNVIRMKFDGAESVKTDTNGDLLFETRYGALRQMKPVVYQDIQGQRRYIAASYSLDAGEVGFSLGNYDRSKKLVIDPILVYSGFLGGSGIENGYAIAVDSAQSAYVAGSTTSTDFPQVSSLSGFRGGAADAFVVKFNPAGSAIVYATYVGGAGLDAATAIGIDSEGGIHVAGQTESADFPQRNPLQNVIGGKLDAFLMKLTSTGTIVYSTFLGGFEDEQVFGLAIDSNNNTLLSGVTRSTNFWASGGLRPAFMGGLTDGWVFKMNPVGQRLWSTYLGGNANDSANGVAVDSVGDVYVTGATQSLNFPVTVGAMQSVIAHPSSTDAFVTKIRADGTAFVYSTYLGGTQYDEGQDIAVTPDGSAYVTGDTDSINFPTLNTLQGPPGNRDTFVTRMNTLGTGVVFSTYLAGSGVDNAADIALDPQGNAYVFGTTTSTNFPVSSPIQPTAIGGQDLYVGKIAANGSARLWVTYLGGVADDIAAGIAVDTNANVYLTGSTTSGDFPRLSASHLTLLGTQDAFITKIAGCDISLVPGAATFTPAQTNGSFTVNAASCPWTAVASDAWITITGGGSGTNSALVTYTVAANAGTARTGYISVSGVRFNITQGGLVSIPPSVLSLAPNAGSGNVQTFTARYSTANPGGSTIERAYLLFNTVVQGAGGCMLEYTPATNSFRIFNDAATAWSAPVLAGTNTTIANSQCSLNAAGSSGSNALVTGAIETTANFAVTFSNTFGGAKNSYLLALSESTGSNSGWVQAGTWTVIGGQTGNGPGVGSLTPTTGSGFTNTFTATFTHAGGANSHYLGYILFLPAPNAVQFTAAGSCMVEYNRISNGMRLIDNAGTGWLGPVQGILLGTPGAVLSNNYCSVNVQNATALVSGTNMIVNAPMTFQTTLGPVLGTFLQAFDVAGQFTGMTQFGNWVIPGAPQNRPGPGIVTILPQAIQGSSVAYSITANHPNGAGALQQIHLLIAERIVGAPGCHVFYLPGSNTLNLVNDAGTGAVSPTGITPGTSGFLSNSRCQVNTAAASVASSGANITLNIPLTFSTGAFSGLKNVYGNAFDNGGLTSHWIQGAVLNVQ